MSIENYGIYAGRSDFELLTSVKKPIVLVGGLNGAGKTTIFESIMVALYGRMYLGRRATKKEYMEFVATRIHRHNGRRAKSACVEIVFRFYHNECEDTYVINRSWTVDGASVSELLSVQKNGEPMADVDESQWQSFIEGLVPLGIAKLFFFDGEKIVGITKWSSHNNGEIRTSFDMLLGAELVNRLRTDLDLYMVRGAGRSGSSGQTQKTYEQILKEKDQIASETEALIAERDRKNAEIADVKSIIVAKESKIAGVGGGYADIRGVLLTQKAVLEEKIRHQDKLLQKALSEDAPLYLVPSMLDRVRKQVEEDVKIIHQKTSASFARGRVHELEKELSSETFWPAGMDAAKISAKISKRLANMFEDPKHDAFFDMSPNDVSWLCQRIDGMEDGQESLSESLHEYGMEKRRLERVESDLAKIPKDDELGPRISEINNLHREVGTLNAEVTHIDQQLASKQSYQKILQNKLKHLIDSIHKNKTASTGIHLASRMQQVLDTYLVNLKNLKMKELESHLLYTVRLLLHKDLIRRIEIDRDTFEIRVYGNGGDQISGGLLSMGERQIVGTALLWAIAKTCGRALPFVIDTPLGRLDGEHLANLIERFYPFASHQIILLSTDREIGYKEYCKLSKYISRSYRITCDQARSTTMVAPGYFTEAKIV